MELTNTHLRYLLAIYDLAQSGGVVSSAQIAAALGVSKPSELVEKARYGKVALTEQGTAAARQYGERLRQLADRLPALGLDLSREEIDAAAGALAAALPERCFGAG